MCRTVCLSFRLCLSRLEVFGNPLGCVPGVPPAVTIDAWSSRKTPRCPDGCTNRTVYVAGDDACVACPVLHASRGLGSVTCQYLGPCPVT